MAIIRIENLRKEFNSGFLLKRSVAVEALTLSVEEGEIFGFLGPNGAGKTTTIKMLMGLIYPTSGKAFLMERPINDVSIRKEIGYLPEQPYFYDYLTAEEFLNFYGGLFEISRTLLVSRIRELLHLVGLTGKEKTQLRKFSKGMLQRIGIAQAIINDPKLIILDEPMSGLDPIGRKEVRDIILHLKGEGKTIFFSSHILPDVEMICDRIGIIGRGNLLNIGRVEELISGMGIKSLELTVEGVNGLLLQELKKTAKNIVQNGRKSLLSFEREEEAREAVEKVVTSGGMIDSLTHQKMSLEEYFVRKIGRSQDE